MKPLASLLNAVQFMTVIPVRVAGGFEGDWLRATAGYFPLVGAGVGLACALALLAASAVWPGAVPAVLALAIGVALTGGLHEDGLADSADGLFGGRNPAQRLAILKDSRIGTYGALALGFALALKLAALLAVPPLLAAAALVAANGVARAAITPVLAFLPYGGDPGTAKLAYAERSASPRGAALAAGFALLSLLWLLWLAPAAAARGLALAAAFAALPPFLAKRWIGGYTGDILGATEQMAEVGFLLGAVAWS